MQNTKRGRKLTALGGTTTNRYNYYASSYALHLVVNAIKLTIDEVACYATHAINIHYEGLIAELA